MFQWISSSLCRIKAMEKDPSGFFEGMIYDRTVLTYAIVKMAARRLHKQKMQSHKV